MKADNSLSREFLLNYPREAARALEQVSASHVAAMLTELAPQTGVAAMTAMLPEKAAACLVAMTVSTSAKLLAEMPVSSAARIYRLLPLSEQNELASCLPKKIQSQIHRYLKYPATSVGMLLSSDIDTLPENVTVADAIRRIQRLEHAVGCDIYIIDDAHHLTGMIDLGKLLVSNSQARLTDVMKRKTHRVSVHANAVTLLSHPGWATRRRLPVVERDNTLVGALEYGRLCEVVGESSTSTNDPLHNLLSLASLYWLSVAQLMDSMLSTARPKENGDQS